MINLADIANLICRLEMTKDQGPLTEFEVLLLEQCCNVYAGILKLQMRHVQRDLDKTNDGEDPDGSTVPAS